MIETADRFVVHFDVLGFKSLLEKNQGRAWHTIQQIYEAQKKSFALEVQSLEDGAIVKNRIIPVVFSDTILAFTRGSTDADVKAIVYLSCELFFAALHAGIPIRGGIAYGRLTWDEERKLFAGAPVVRAYELGETAQWLGIVVDPMVQLRSRKLAIRVTEEILLIEPWIVPLKAGSEKRPAVNWPASHRRKLKVKPPLSIQDFYQIFEPSFGPFESLKPNDQVKYVNTLDFFNTKIEPFKDEPFGLAQVVKTKGDNPL
ncbi:MAG: hypothetical protein ACLQAT_03815 [Candidatus Binataceae bacterium]